MRSWKNETFYYMVYVFIHFYTKPLKNQDSEEGKNLLLFRGD